MTARHSSGLIELSDTTPVELWRVSINRKARIVKIMVYNGDTADHYIEFGQYDPDTATWEATKLPKIPVLAGQLLILAEQDIPREYVVSKKENDTITVKSWAIRLDTTVTANNVELIAEIEEE